jgi:hypothetical protein
MHTSNNTDRSVASCSYENIDYKIARTRAPNEFVDRRPLSARNHASGLCISRDSLRNRSYPSKEVSFLDLMDYLYLYRFYCSR